MIINIFARLLMTINFNKQMNRITETVPLNLKSNSTETSRGVKCHSVVLCTDEVNLQLLATRGGGRGGIRT